MKTTDATTSLATLVCIACLAAVLSMLLAGCGSTAPAKEAANVTHDVGIAGAEVLRAKCVEPMERAMTEAEINAVNARGCRNAVRAYDGMRRAHLTIVAVIKATDSAACAGVSKVSRECNLAGSYFELSKAAAEWASAIKEIQEAP